MTDKTIIQYLDMRLERLEIDLRLLDELLRGDRRKNLGLIAAVEMMGKDVAGAQEQLSKLHKDKIEQWSVRRQSWTAISVAAIALIPLVLANLGVIKKSFMNLVPKPKTAFDTMVERARTYEIK